MIVTYNRTARLSLAAADGAVVAATLAGYGAWTDRGAGFTQIAEALPFAAFYGMAWVALLGFNGLYGPVINRPFERDARALVQAAALMALLVLAGATLLSGQTFLGAADLVLVPAWAALSFALRVGLRTALGAVTWAVPRERTLLVVGSPEDADAAAADAIRAQGQGRASRVVGFLAPDGRPSRPHLAPYLGLPRDLSTVIAEHAVDAALFCFPTDQSTETAELVGQAMRAGIDVRLVSGERLAEPAARGSARAMSGLAVATVASNLGAAAKRALDIVGAIVGLIVLAPLLAVVSLAILVFDGRPIVFSQVRAGRDGRPFRMVKFRTMVRDADAARAQLRKYNEVAGGASFKMTNDPRITPIGRFLRKTSIDELPQLWNVLRGSMSLVGPRPHPLDDLSGYRPWHWRRLEAKPGITGLWQIGARTEGDFDAWVRRDLDYIDKWSIWLDVQVIALTIPALFRAEGR